MIPECNDSLLRKFDPNQDYLWMWNPSKGKSGGILVAILLERFDVGSFKQGGFMLKMNLWDKVLKIKWNLLTVYGAAQEENKLSFLSELSHFCASSVLLKRKTPWMVYINTQTFFNSVIQFYELRELYMNGGLYTWSNNQENPILEKLDRILVTREWEDLFPQAMVNKLPREVSDHNPLIISSGKKSVYSFYSIQV